MTLADLMTQLHIETLHPDNGDGPSPFIAKDNDDSSLRVLREDGEQAWMNEAPEEEYVECPQEGCGEALLLVELEGHVEMHEQERAGTGSGDVSGSEDESGGRGSGSSKRVKLDSVASSNGPKRDVGDKLVIDRRKEEEERREHERAQLEEYERQLRERSPANRRQQEENGHGEEGRRCRKMSPGIPESSPSKKNAVVAAW